MSSRTCVIKDFLGNTVFIFLSGIIMAIINEIPKEWLPETSKIFAIIGVGVVTSICIIGKLFYNDLKRYIQAKKIVDEYYETLPRILFFRKLKREVSIDITGNAKIVYELDVINKSRENVRTLNIPMVTEMGLPAPSDGKYVKMEKMLIGTKEITDVTNRCYKEKGILETKDGRKEQYGNLVIPFTDISSLPKESEKEVKVEFSVYRLYPNICEKESTAVQIRHPTERVEIIINAPKDWKLIILTPDMAPEGIEVQDASAGLVDMDVTHNTEKPTLKSNDTKLEWNIDKPRINYVYKVYFRISK